MRCGQNIFSMTIVVAAPPLPLAMSGLRRSAGGLGFGSHDTVEIRRHAIAKISNSVDSFCDSVVPNTCRPALTPRPAFQRSKTRFQPMIGHESAREGRFRGLPVNRVLPA